MQHLDDRHEFEMVSSPATVSIEATTWPLPCLFVLVSCAHGETAGMLDRGSRRAERREMERHLVDRHRREKRCGCAGEGIPAGRESGAGMRILPSPQPRPPRASA